MYIYRERQGWSVFRQQAWLTSPISRLTQWHQGGSRRRYEAVAKVSPELSTVL